MGIVNRVRCNIICVAIIAAAGALFAQEKPAPPEVVTLANNLVRADNFDAALAEFLDKLKTLPDSPEVAQAKLTAAFRCLWQDKPETSIALATEVIERHPDPSLTSSALLTLGSAYHRLKEKAKAVDALERGLAMTRAMKNGAANKEGYAVHQILGAHYLVTRQWDKALQIYDEWQPSSFCGNCYEAMESERQKTLLVCLVHTNRHADAANAAWSMLIRPKVWAPKLRTDAALALIRLYDEAGQCDDLMRLLDELDPPVLAAADDDTLPVAAVKPGEKTAMEDIVAEIRWALRLTRIASERTRINAFLAKDDDAPSKSSPLTRHVAGWLLARDHKNAVSRIVTLARKANHDSVNLAQLLAAIHTPAAKNGLANRATGKMGPEVCQVILAHFEDAEEVILREHRTPLAVSRLAELEPSFCVDYGHFYADWPKPVPGSIPKELPAALLAGKQK